MALAPCKECGRQVSTQAKACPGCGGPPPKLPRQKISWKGWLALVASIFILAAYFGDETTPNSKGSVASEGRQTPEDKNSQLSDKSRQAVWVEKGKDAVRLKLKDPDSAQFRKTYFHRGKSGVPVACGQVNAKNGMGGYSGFQRFVSGTTLELTFLESDVEGFTKVWNELCAN